VTPILVIQKSGVTYNADLLFLTENSSALVQKFDDDPVWKEQEGDSRGPEGGAVGQT
jgi:hypothetical protein